MRKTQLMMITEKYSNNKHAGYADTYVVDSMVYMICDVAEGVFGQKFIEAIAEDIVYTQTGANKVDTLSFMVNTFIKDHVAIRFGKFKKDLQELPPFNEKNTEDYFVAFMQIESGARDNMEKKAANQLQPVLFGMTSASPYATIVAIVEYFKATNDELGLFQVIQKVCQHLKLREDLEDDEA